MVRKLLTLVIVLSVMISCIPIPVTQAVYGNGYIGGRAGDGVGIYAHGVDISQWQGGEVDYHKIKAQGYSFVILRAGFSVYQDKYFERNYTAAKEAGLHVGVYLYSYAVNVAEVLREAEALKGWLKGKTLEYPVYYDMEEPDTHGQMSATALTELSMAFLDSVAEDGWLVGLYSCKSWLVSKLQTDIICKEYECWMGMYLPSGDYSTYDKYDEFCGIWQYSSTGSVDGVPGNVDMNVAFKDYPSICMQYGLNGYAPNGERLTLRDGNQTPRVIAKGDQLKFGGKVTSIDGDLKDVTVGIYDNLGNQMIAASAQPRTSNYDIANLSLDTAALPLGSYIYRVTATNDKYTKTLQQQKLVVSLIGLMSNGVRAPEDLRIGESYVPQGEVESSTPIKEILIMVKDANNRPVMQTIICPETNIYALPALAANLDFTKLPMGEYTYIVSVKNQLGSEMVVNEKFSVWLREDPISLDGVVVQSEYLLDELTSLLGTVKSNQSNLRNVSVSILNRNEEVLMSASTSGSKQVSIGELSKKMALDTLSFGTYYCLVEATNDAGPVELLRKQFIIKPDGLSLCDLTAPVSVYCGDSFQISGAVASDYSVLQFVSVSVLDQFGQVVFDKAAIVNVMVYDLSEIAKHLRFSDLAVGEYTLRISAKNATTHQVLYNSTFCVTDQTDILYWSGEHTSTNGVSYGGSAEMQLCGTICSSQSDILSVKTEVFTQDGVLVNAGEFLPQSGSMDIREFKDVMRLSALAAGKYRVVITAQNESVTFVMLDEVFYVSECTHSDVRSGVMYEQRCDRLGVICDSRCAACGERTRIGTMLLADEHEWTDDGCKYCGEELRNFYQMQQAKSCRNTGRYAFAYCHDGNWYALDIFGKTCLINAPNTDGSLTITSEFIWIAKKTREGFYFTNPFGQNLHLSSNEISACDGLVNTLITMNVKDGCAKITANETDRAICFETDAFTTGATGTQIAIFELPVGNG